jgi:D-3-phosphoglycerate dehydrogenase
MKYNVLLTDYAWPDLDIERSILAEYDAELVVSPSGDPAVLKRLAPEADAIMTNWVDVRAEVIDAASKCRIISRLGIGLDCIDVQHATARGIPVTNVPDYCLIEVAEHTIALLLALARKLHVFLAGARAGRYDLSAGFPLRRIQGQTLGIVGLGNTGREVAKRALALGLRVVATNRSRRDPILGVPFVELVELLRESDFVSLHLPLNKDTRHLIGASQLAQMKQSAFLLNTARGGLIDHAALAAALAQYAIAGAALDVQDPEPPNLSQPPWNDPRVIVTPHAAFYSNESVDELRRRASRQVGMRLAGGRPENVVNPEVL